MWTVRDLMTPDPLCVSLEEDLETCAQLLRDRSIRHLLVVNALGHLAGYVSDAAVAAARARGGGEARAALAPVDLTARDDEPAVDVIARMIATPWDFVAVMARDRRPMGIVTEHDVVRLASKDLHPDLRASRHSSAPVITAAVSETGGSALQRMIAHRLRHLVVVDSGGRLAGVLSWRDMVAADVGEDATMEVHELLSGREVEKVVLDASLRQAAGRMEAARIGALPLVDQDNRVLWVITRTDVMRAFVEQHLRGGRRGRTLTTPPSGEKPGR